MVSRLATASPPAARISATTASAGGSTGASATPSVSLIPTPRSFTSTFAPRAANISAYSRPRLRPAPVTTTTLPSNPSSSLMFVPPFGVGGVPLRHTSGAESSHSSVYTGVRPSFHAAIFSSKLLVVMRT